MADNPYQPSAADPACPPIRHVPWWRWDLSPVIGLGYSVTLIVGHMAWVPKIVALSQEAGLAVPAWAQWVMNYGIYVAVLLGVMSAIALVRFAQSADRCNAGWLGRCCLAGGLLGLLVAGAFFGALVMPLVDQISGRATAPPTAPPPLPLLPSPLGEGSSSHDSWQSARCVSSRILPAPKQAGNRLSQVTIDELASPGRRRQEFMVLPSSLLLPCPSAP